MIVANQAYEYTRNGFQAIVTAFETLLQRYYIIFGLEPLVLTDLHECSKVLRK